MSIEEGIELLSPLILLLATYLEVGLDLFLFLQAAPQTH
jgi:hypothetical protein